MRRSTRTGREILSRLDFPEREERSTGMIAQVRLTEGSQCSLLTQPIEFLDGLLIPSPEK